MFHNSKFLALACGAGSIAINIVFYLLTFDTALNAPMKLLSILFLILAEIIITIKISRAPKTIITISSITASFIHITAILILSIIYTNIFPLLIKQYILLNILVLCVLFILDFTVFNFYSYIFAKNTKLKESQYTLLLCVEKAKSLLIKYSETIFIKDLEEITSLLQYSDNSCLSDHETRIIHKLDVLDDLLQNGENNDDIQEAINELKNIINIRNISVQTMKRGNY